MVPNTTKIVFDCERMKYPHTGLYYFCLHLGKALLQNADGRDIYYYTPKKNIGIFGKSAHYVKQHTIHKLKLPRIADFDLWHSVYQTSSYFPFEGDLPVVLTIHDLNFIYDQRKSKEKKEYYLEKLQRRVEKASRVVAISEYTLSDLKKHVEVDEKKCSVIYNGCNIVSLLSGLPPLHAPVKPFLFTIGTIIEKKNFHVLPPLLQGNDWLLLIAGITITRSYKRKILSVAQEHGVRDRVVFLGAITEADKQWFMQNCRAFVFPSLSEGFGLPVVEAMHFGKPVILSKSTSLPEIGGESAYYFNSFEPESMKETLEVSLNDYDNTPSREEEIKIRSRVFTWDKSAKEYLDIYDSLLKKNI